MIGKESVLDIIQFRDVQAHEQEMIMGNGKVMEAMAKSTGSSFQHHRADLGSSTHLQDHVGPLAYGDVRVQATFHDRQVLVEAMTLLRRNGPESCRRLPSCVWYRAWQRVLAQVVPPGSRGLVC